jgi:hypothetical protein
MNIELKYKALMETVVMETVMLESVIAIVHSNSISDIFTEPVSPPLLFSYRTRDSPSSSSPRCSALINS